MKTSLTLAYGASQMTFACGPQAQEIRLQDPPAQVDPPTLERRLHAFLQRASLDLRRPVVVVADKTRLCGYPDYLPIMLETLTAWGAPAGGLRLLIAYGTHARQSEAECARCYGPVYSRHAWIHHRCDDARAFVFLGRTGRGTPIRMRADLMEASAVITFGAISHHYFAGFGGGRKLIFPGLGEKAAIYANHGLFLDRPHRVLTSGCRAGRLEGNPLAEDLAEVEAARPADMAIHGILDRHGQVCDLLVGRGPEHFRAACARHAGFYETDAPTRFDLVLASCGGFPKDINFIQSHKAIHNAAAFVRDGGHLIVLARCPDGIGSQTFLPWFESGGWDAAFDRLAGDYVGNGGTALAMMAKLQRLRISLVTDLPPELARTIGFECLSGDQVQAVLKEHTGSLAVIPDAGLLVKKPAA
jgi:lactate racemase